VNALVSYYSQTFRIAFAGVLLLIPAAWPAMAQQSQAPSVDLQRAVRYVQFYEAASPAAAAQGSQAAESPVLRFFNNTELSGFVDMYYSYNFNQPADGVNKLYNFNTQHNAFSFNLAEIALIKAPTEDSRAGFRLDLDYGPAAAMVNAFEPGKETAILEHTQQAYVSYLAPGRGIQFDFGKFVTQHGAEVIETKDNWNYSRSLLFAWAIPYYHMGARVSVPVNDKLTFAAAVVNGWNNVFENNTGKTIGLQAMIKPVSSVTIVQNYMGGPEQTGNNDDWRHLSDTTVTITATPKVSLIANYDYGREKISGETVSWQGAAGYVKFQATDVFALIPRFEWFDDDDGWATIGDTITEFTLTAEVKSAAGLLMRAEYRGDFGDKSPFLKKALEFVNSQHTFTIGFIYAFSSKTP
jgi:putative OmpL-like beta-barrel porin-2